MGMLNGKAIVVTGAAQGLGRAHAVAAAAAGARVVVNDVNGAGLSAVVEEIRGAGGEAVGHTGSVSDYAACGELVAACQSSYGAIDGLVSNAALYHRATPEEETEQGLRRIVEVNVLGSLFVALQAFEAMRAQGHGVIINTTSGAHLGIMGMTAYGTTKGAVASLTYNLALEGRQHGIRVNALSPIAQTAQAAGEPDRPDGQTRPDPEAIAPAMVFLLSDRARDITGQLLRFDSWTLSFISTPHSRTKKVETDEWSAEEIARLYETKLRDERRPVGLASLITFDPADVVRN